MAFCANCGTQVEGRFCAKCGTSVQAAPAPQAPPPQAPQPQWQAPPPPPTPPPPNPGYQPHGGYQPPPPPPNPGYQQPPAQAGGLEDNIAGALCYLLGLITGVLFLALAPYNQNRTIRFHAFQSIFMNVALMGVYIAMTILSMMMPRFIRALFGLGFLVVWLGSVGLWLFMMYKAYNREKVKLPIIGDLAEKQA